MRIFISGATGCMAADLIPRLLKRGHEVCALTRPGSESKVPSGCSLLIGDALDASTLIPVMPPVDVYVHLVGARKPAPWKGSQFQSVDLPSLCASVQAARSRRAGHFVYVSVARPAPVMREYQKVRATCEDVLAASRLDCTILRPWYVLGPGHLWPYAILPFYKLAELLPSTRPAALRLGLLQQEEMTRALLWSVENPVAGTRCLDVPAIRSLSSQSGEQEARFSTAARLC